MMCDPAPAAVTALVRQAYQESLALLRRNLTADGIMAASASAQAEERNYTRVFARDAAICALGMLRSRDAELVKGARAGLLTLAQYQADNGQIPQYVDAPRHSADFWYVGCIDATLWWLIAVDYFTQHAPEHGVAETLRENIGKAIVWLRCQEHPETLLVQQNEASDWADIMPRSGFVLYSNALWYHVKQRYNLPQAAGTRQHFNQLFAPRFHTAPASPRLRLMADFARRHGADSPLYLSFVNLLCCGEDGDVFGNLLAVLLGLADAEFSAGIIDALAAARIDIPYPIASVLDAIHPGDPLWRSYMARHGQNFPHQYHNGGHWPFLGGFWVIALARAGRTQQAAAALQNLATANALNAWQFNEWLHGNTGQPQGMPGQSWNAAMFVLACEALQRPVF